MISETHFHVASEYGEPPQQNQDLVIWSPLGPLGSLGPLGPLGSLGTWVTRSTWHER